ncbi:TIGR03619 family F420-dependent LLM class oxidoreductase [Aquamicrobium sp. LC103]|uniref:TIGR03619 family F420-dependent LLM class oxidoreductase n=1 Tax=Aquamicrobium sp. LC103 TaxID=1120658 RepID=UPI00069AB540|nr:TIGR03619 family F420-dependent LLM class oxidoreductase [Aquamicrobium sp. LC103]TKT74488.1 TIGR03619 family F420-dependent LLM class oxidoreductase [Aquamicrobium sp. LC103]
MLGDGTVEFAVNVNEFTHNADWHGMMEFITTADQLGYHKMRFVDHVVGVVAEKHPEMDQTPYTHVSAHHEVFTLMAYLAALTKNIKLVTGVLNLPQRQTALVAKQAAEVDFLSGGRALLACGLGYNSVEFEAMGWSLKDRGKRADEQIPLLRRLWTEETVTHEGMFDTMRDVGINPKPLQQPIPIWLGAGRTDNPVPPEAAEKRIAKLADGWCPLFAVPNGERTLNDEAIASINRVNQYARDLGRDPETELALEIGIHPSGKPKEKVLDEIKALHDLGAKHLHARFTGKSAREQIDELKRFADFVS